MERSLPTPEHLSPGYFAMVMGTGILSIGTAQRGWQMPSLVLLGLAAVAYALLCALNVWRLLRFRPAFDADMHDTRKAFLAFTFVAATDVLAAALAGQGAPTALVAVLLAVGTLAWLVLGYSVPWAAVLNRSERPVTAAANGTWFIWVVASQSVSVVAALLETQVDAAQSALAILAVLAWSVGLALYCGVAIFVALRMLVYPLDPREFDPPYWVSMGAIAITIVAGARIVEMQSTPMVDAVRGLVAGVAVVLWGFATWLIPVLFAVGYWRHWLKKVPLRYEPTMWSIVFPLGMYAVACMYLGRADNLPIVRRLGELWIWVALAAWTATFAGMVHSWFAKARAAAV